MHGDISITYRQYHNNLHGYQLAKYMNSALKKTVVASIDGQWIKWKKDMLMGYANKSFVELTEWLYVRYRQITPGDLMKNQYEMQATYNVK